ncbi:protein of unknown function [Candidatus Nitrospira inopinata]|uniref:Uncharacterized protein n=1 Tax=Candidatus Nitrospira inopinata TaxID=1715989 RepID=A0A0S4KZ19_9BACT|nr:protein of unknown function [Candidatus Nitrospira inopinata]
MPGSRSGLHCTIVFTNKQEPEKGGRGIVIALPSEKRPIKEAGDSDGHYSPGGLYELLKMSGFDGGGRSSRYSRELCPDVDSRSALCVMRQYRGPCHSSESDAAANRSTDDAET